MTLTIGIVILNGFAAGVVASIHLWGGSSTVSKRAALGALGAGIAATVLILVPVLSEGGESLAIVAVICALVLASGTAASLPGAIIISRRIGDSVSIDPDTFA
ncbi:MAG: hypothetical protein JY451_12535 [Erythrobacter sp.]|nr:MAG: hypothetical protein JY451_12535 [Erythrobacter sp.]